MHIHLRSSEAKPDVPLVDENAALLDLFLPNGVVGVREMGGDLADFVFRWREEIRSGKRIDPRILTAGRKIDQVPPAWPGSLGVETPEAARAGWADLWAGGASVGLAGTAGNARTLTFTAGLNAARATNTDKTSVYFNAIKASAFQTARIPIPHKPFEEVLNKQGEGLVLDIILGIIGAVAGGWLFRAFGASGVTGLNIYSLVLAVVGAIVVPMVYHGIRRAT